MPKRDEPRVMVRLSPEDEAVIKAAARYANVAVAGLIRECAVRYAAAVAADVRRGSTRLRRGKAVEAVRGQVQPASSLVVEGGLTPYDVMMRERQARLNARVERARKP